MNKGRLIDILLIVTLVLVAFGITYTLLTLNRGQTRPPPDPGSPAQTQQLPDQPDLPQIGIDSDLPVIPDGLPSADPPVEPLGPGGQADEADTDQDTTETDTEQDEPAAQPPRTLAAGEVQLESVGFSFVTGGAGACGVVLEPWVHVAVSRDLLADLGCGAQVEVELADTTGGRNTVNATIGDTMNPSHTLTVNVYVGQDEPALEYGRTTGILLAP